MKVMKWFWQGVYWLWPVTERTSRTAYVRAACRMHGIKAVEHTGAMDYTGLGWVGVTESKICAEAGCNHVYVPDHTGKCPKCGSEGMWINNTVIGRRGDR